MHKTAVIFLLMLSIASTEDVHAQKRFEIGIKPSQLIFTNFEVNAGWGKKRQVIGLILSYRPATKDSGTIKGAGDAIGGGYSLQNMFNKLYTAYTIGIYRKVNMVSPASVFVETDLFYRNWNFKNKQAEYSDVEGYRFKGNRTEHVDVGGAKLLLGNTFLINKKKPLNFYIDGYAGVGIRYKRSVYETREGSVMDIYYDYKKDILREILPSVHFGIRTGIMKRR